MSKEGVFSKLWYFMLGFIIGAIFTMLVFTIYLIIELGLPVRPVPVVDPG